MRTLAHISDLHIGRSAETDRRAVSLCRRLQSSHVDHVVVTGDVTHRGRAAELSRFREIFAPLEASGRLSIVPGNHDRLGDEIAVRLMPAGVRVASETRPGLHIVRFDSTGPHNRAWMSGHGLLTAADVVAIADALAAAPPDALAVLLLHHHVLPYPHDTSAEWFVSLLGSPVAEELPRGRALLEAIRGRCDLVLHGHRHNPGSTTAFADGARPLSVFNAGSSTSLGHVRIFAHAAGRLVAAPRWLDTGARAPRAAALREHVVAF